MFLIVPFLRGEPAGHWAFWIVLLFPDPINNPPPFYVFILQPSQRSLPFLTLEGSVTRSSTKKPTRGCNPCRQHVRRVEYPSLQMSTQTATGRTTQSGRGADHTVDPLTWHRLLVVAAWAISPVNSQRVGIGLGFLSLSSQSFSVVFRDRDPAIPTIWAWRIGIL